MELMTDELLNQKQLMALRDILSFYKEFQEELYDYPEPDTLFTSTQLELFEMFDIVWFYGIWLRPIFS